MARRPVGRENSKWIGHQFDAHANRHKTLEQRFAEKVSPEPNTGCWLWTGAVDKDGYGFIQIDGQLRRAHRVSLEQKLGARLAASLQACHTCDVPSCVNPDHLYAGSNGDNQRDAVARGTNKGWKPVPRLKAPAAKLTEDDVYAIRSRPAEKAGVLAAEFGVSPSTINRIRARTKWSHLP